MGGPGADSPYIIKQDLDKARQLLTEAGYANGFEMDFSTFKWTRSHLVVVAPPILQISASFVKTPLVGPPIH